MAFMLVPMILALMGTWLATRVQALTPLSQPKYLGEYLELKVLIWVSNRWPSLLECSSSRMLKSLNADSAAVALLMASLAACKVSSRK